LLVRHGTCAQTADVLLGRAIDAPLDERGEREAAAVAARLAGERPALIEASPRRRTQQTAQAIAARLGLPVTTSPALDELDFGAWAGRRFDELATDPAWLAWNGRRASATTPSGEDMPGVQARITAHLGRLARAFPTSTIILVTHAEMIRAALLHYLGLSADRWQELSIEPASVSTLRVAARSARRHARIDAIGERSCA
jgi:probable phosphoglycerate mutase